MAAALTAVLLAGTIVYFSPAAAAAFGIGSGCVDAAPSFSFDGFKVQLAGVYADSNTTVVDLKGAPPGQVFGRTYLNDQFQNTYPQLDAEPSNTGDMALSYEPATRLVAVTGMRYTLHVEQADNMTVVGVSTLCGVAFLNTAPSLLTPPSGSFGVGTVKFSEARYGAQVVAIRFEVRGVTVVGGYPPSEASVKPRPSLEVRLVPAEGGLAKVMRYRASESGDVTQVHAIAMLVAPGTYRLDLRLEGVAEVQRLLVVK
jgi:hypothetical protein